MQSAALEKGHNSELVLFFLSLVIVNMNGTKLSISHSMNVFGIGSGLRVWQ